MTLFLPQRPKLKPEEITLFLVSCLVLGAMAAISLVVGFRMVVG